MWIVVLLALQAADAGKIDAKQKELAAALKQAKTPEGLNYVAEQYLSLAADAAEADLYDPAGKAAEQAGKIAAGTKNAELAERAKQKTAEIKAKSTEFGKARSFIKVLEEKPDDPAANLAVGKYLCFVKGDWQRGLPCLAKGSDDALKKLASKEDLVGAGGSGLAAEIRLELAEDWWPKNHDRALHWYKRSWPDLNPLQKERVRERFREAQARGEPKPKGALPTSWFFQGQTAPAPNAILMDGTYVRGGRSALRIEGGAQPGVLNSQTKPVAAGKKYVFSAWVLTEKTQLLPAGLIVRFTTPDKKDFDTQIPAPADQPWWTRLERTVEAPAGTATVTIMIPAGFKEGRLWVDSVSLRAEDGTDLADNGDFEK